MSDDTPQRMIPKLKEDRVLRQIRKQIITGRYAPGSRLPTRAELEDEHEVSRQTMQNVFDSLINEGFVESRGRHGTFVTEHPPHLSNYGIVFTRHPSDDDGWPNFWTAIFNEAQDLHRDGKRHFHAFYGGAFDDRGSGSYEDLSDMVTSGRLAGLIFPARPFHLKGTPILEQPGMPRMMLSGADMVPGAMSVRFNSDRLVSKAISYLKQCGRSRIAFIVGFQARDANTVYAECKEACEEHGVKTRYDWIHACTPQHGTWAARVTALLARLPEQERPDGLIIGDDNLVNDAVSGLIRNGNGIHVGQNLDVVAHTNFPWVTPSPVPITRIGFDIRKTVRLCIEAIDRQRRGEHPPSITHIEPVFENEID